MHHNFADIIIRRSSVYMKVNTFIYIVTIMYEDACYEMRSLSVWSSMYCTFIWILFCSIYSVHDITYVGTCIIILIASLFEYCKSNNPPPLTTCSCKVTLIFFLRVHARVRVRHLRLRVNTHRILNFCECVNISYNLLTCTCKHNRFLTYVYV